MNDTRLIHSLLDNIDYDEYKLHDTIKKWIYNFINDYDKIFIQLDTDLHTIRNERKIELYDIPTIIKIIADTYYSPYCNCNNFNATNLYIFIKYTLLVILDTELLILSETTSKESLTNIVDSSMDLLNMNLTQELNECIDIEHGSVNIQTHDDRFFCKCFIKIVQNMLKK